MSQAQREHVVAGAPQARALQIPVRAVEWSCHAPTTIKDARGEVIAECTGHGRDCDVDIAAAAEIVRRLNTHAKLLEELRSASSFLQAACLVISDPQARKLALDQVRRARIVIADAASTGAP